MKEVNSVKDDPQKYMLDRININTDSGCWLWQLYCNPDGYGQFKIQGRTLRTHRAAWEFFVGDIPEGSQVLHKCDVPNCCNPEHLFLGSHSDNMIDMWNKSRHPKPQPSTGGKLTAIQVNEIRLMKGEISGNKLASYYNVNGQSIRNIWLGITWRDNEK